MRVVQIIPTLEQEASGPSQSVPNLALALQRYGHDVELVSVGDTANPILSELRHASYRKDFAELPLISDLWLSGGMHRHLLEVAGHADIIHSHSLWVMPNVYPAWAAKRAGKPLVISPRGTLSPVALARSPTLKQAFWRILQGPAVAQAALLHATSMQEYEDIRRRGLRQPVAIIPNGVALPELLQRHARPGGPRRLLYLGRVHPIKGLDVLIRAWAAAAARFPEWELRIVGPGEPEYEQRLRRLAAGVSAPRVTFAGPRYGLAKSEEYQDADVYVLPSFSENFGMSAAEALAHGLPVISTTGTPWKGLEANGCGWWVTPDEEGLGAALDQALSRPADDLARMGVAGRRWMGSAYSWSFVAEQMTQVYAWLLGTGPKPDTVMLR